jgi:hypothetical protein
VLHDDLAARNGQIDSDVKSLSLLAVLNADLRAWCAETARPYYGHGFDAPTSGPVISLSTAVSRRNYRADKNPKQNPLDGIVSAIKNPSENLGLGEFCTSCA